jgi:hypothetical protein
MRIETTLSKKVSEKIRPLPTLNPENENKEHSENTVWDEENSIKKTCK